MPGSDPTRGSGIDQRIAAFPVPVALCFLVFFGCYLYVFDAKYDINGDNAAYLALAESLETGLGYARISDPARTPETHFPPGYPVFLALFLKASSSLVFLKALNGGLLLGSLLLSLALYRRLGLPPAFGAAAVAVLATNETLLRYSTILMSECLFLFLTLLSILFLLRRREGDRPWTDPWMLALVLALSAAYHVRSAGLATVAAIVAWLVLARSFRSAAWTAGLFALSALPWHLRSRAVGGETYVGQFLQIDPYHPEAGTVSLADLVARVGENVGRYLSKGIPEAVLPLKSTSFLVGKPGLEHWAIGAVIVALAGYGLYRLPRHRSLVGLLLAATFGLLLLWPSIWAGNRFLVGVVPFLTVLQLWAVHRLVSDRLPRLPSSWPLAWMLVLFFPLSVLHDVAQAPYPRAWIDYFEVARWVEKNTPEGTIVSARKPNLFHRFAKRPTAKYSFTSSAEEQVRFLEEIGARYVVVDHLGYGSTTEFMISAILENQDRFTAVYGAGQEPRTYLFEIHPPR